MSASRAMASARNKKAGGNNPNPALSIQEQSSTVDVQGSSQSPSVTKVTIPQAIQMLSSRVDTLEEKLQSTLESVEGSKIFEEQAENKYLVDAKVFESIVSRLEKLEGGSFNEKMKLPEVQNMQGDIADIDNKFSEFKNDFMKLQTYVMDTNAKLTEVVFSIPVESMVEYRDIFTKKSDEQHDHLPVPMNRMTSTPDITEMEFEKTMDPSCLERPVLTRQTNEFLGSQVPSNMTNINDLLPTQECDGDKVPTRSQDNEEIEVAGL